MTRKDYVMLAAAIRAVAMPDNIAQVQSLRIANEIAHRLAQDNSRFDRGRFLAACGVAS